MSDNRPVYLVPVDPQMYGLGMALGCLIKFWPIFAAIGAILFGGLFFYNLIFVYPDDVKNAKATEIVLDQLAVEREADYHNCIGEATSSLQNNPKDVEAYFRRGRCYQEVEWYNFKRTYSDTELRSLLEMALADFNAVIKNDPSYTKVYVYKGLVCERLGLKSEALEAYEIWVANPPPDTYQQSIDSIWQRIHLLRSELGQ